MSYTKDQIRWLERRVELLENEINNEVRQSRGFFDIHTFPTLRGEVEAILEHLGLSVEVTPEQVTASEVKVVKKTAKKAKK